MVIGIEICTAICIDIHTVIGIGICTVFGIVTVIHIGIHIGISIHITIGIHSHLIIGILVTIRTLDSFDDMAKLENHLHFKLINQCNYMHSQVLIQFISVIFSIIFECSNASQIDYNRFCM